MNMPKFLLTLILSCVIITPSLAQRKKQKAPKVDPLEVINKHVSIGDYPQALELIEEELTKQQKLKRPTCDIDALDSLANVLRIAEANIRSTQQVVFIDSIILPKDKALQQLSLNPEMGKICPASTLQKLIHLKIDSLGEAAYLNALGDNAFLPVTHDGVRTLSRTMKTGRQWSQPEPLEITEHEDVDQDYPFLLADGVSLYYAAQAEDGIGGWDIYVTRYDNEDKTFLKPQNIGMPFNSEANDYMYYIDESTNTGYFLTDRRLSPDSVCLYTFIPNAIHTPYPTETDFVELFQAANIHSIATTQIGQEEKIAEWKTQQQVGDTGKESASHLQFIINNTTVYHKFDDFKSTEAKQLAQQLAQHYASFKSQEALLKSLRKQYGENPSTMLYDNILQIELEREQTLLNIKKAEKQMRDLENQQLNIRP